MSVSEIKFKEEVFFENLPSVPTMFRSLLPLKRHASDCCMSVVDLKTLMHLSLAASCTREERELDSSSLIGRSSGCHTAGQPKLIQVDTCPTKTVKFICLSEIILIKQYI